MARQPRANSVDDDLDSSSTEPAGRRTRSSENPDPEPDPDSVARTICLRLLTIRARTRSELAEALTAREVPPDAAERVLNRLAGVGLINDLAFATDFVSSRRADRGLASRELHRQLHTKGVDDDIIEQVLSTIDADSEYQTARHLAERKVRSMSRLEPVVQTRRLAGLLARKGYPPSLTFRVVREVVGAAAISGTDEDAGLG